MRVGVVCVAIAGLACGDEPGAPAPAVSAQPQAVRSAGDPLLRQTLLAMREGRVDGEAVARLRTSAEPVHQHAARLLAAIAGEVTAAPPLDPPAVSVALAPEGSPTPAPVPVADPDGASAAGPAAPASAPPASPADREGGDGPQLRRLTLGRTASGATLTLGASSAAHVGVVEEHDRGLVRLMVEGRAAAGLLRARPRLSGAAVTGVRAVGRSVLITLALDPGWTLERIDRNAGGASVHLRRP